MSAFERLEAFLDRHPLEVTLAGHGLILAALLGAFLWS